MARFLVFVTVFCVFLGAFSFAQDENLSVSSVDISPNVSELISPATDRAIQDALGYFRRKMDAGRVLGDGAFRNHSAIVALVGMAFLASGSTPTEGADAKYVSRCVEILLEQARPGGVIAEEDVSGQSLMYGNGFALMFLAECYGMSPEDERMREVIQNSVRMLIAAQNEEGGWRYTPYRGEADVSVSACVVMALRAARNAGFFVPAEVIEKAREYFIKCRNPDGGFRYRTVEGESAFPRTAGVLTAMCATGIYEGHELRSGLVYLVKTPNPSEEPFYFYAQYYAIQAFWLYDESAGAETPEAEKLSWRKWYLSAGGELLKLQKPDGTWNSTISVDCATAMAAVMLQVPNHFLPILQR